MNKASDYKAIRFWGERTGSYEYYIARQQQLAANENASFNSIYKSNDGIWMTLDDVKNKAVIYEAKMLGLM